jgi:hypothetical protein
VWRVELLRPDPKKSSKYDEAHRFADTLFPRDLWDLGQADLEKITETFRSLASNVGAVLRLNPSVKYPHPGRSLVKRVGNAEVRVELALIGPKQKQLAPGGDRVFDGFPDRPEEFRYALCVFRTPRQGFLSGPLHRPRRDPTEWQLIGEYTAADVRQAASPLREALESTARNRFLQRADWPEVLADRQI